MSIYINREGCIVDNECITELHISELTVVKDENPYYNEPTKIFEVFKLHTDRSFAVPRYWGRTTFDVSVDIQDFGYICHTTNLVFEGCLKSDIQQYAADTCIQSLQNTDGGVLSIPTGMGKTVIALYISCALKVKTLVVVHKQFLMSQWIERIRQFIPTARIGSIQQDRVEVENCDIIVGMLQSIAMREYNTRIFSDIGLVIFDEVHVVPTPVFSQALMKLSVPYMLGLSATPRRRDGMSKIIHWFLGPILFEHSLEDRDDVTVRVVTYTPSFKVPRNKQGIINMTAVTSILCNLTSRNLLILQNILDLVSDGHKVIALSDRRSHCEVLMHQLIYEYNIQSALYIGGMKDYELEESKEKDVLLATYAMAKEGLDIPSLDALVLATPRSDVVQACGRILHSNTCKPAIIVDVLDDWFLGVSQFNKRQLYYTGSGFTVTFQ